MYQTKQILLSGENTKLFTRRKRKVIAKTHIPATVNNGEIRWAGLQS